MTTSITDVRPTLAQFFADRNYSCLPDGNFVGWYSRTTPMVGVFLDAGRVAVQMPGDTGSRLEVSVDDSGLPGVLLPVLEALEAEPLKGEQ